MELDLATARLPRAADAHGLAALARAGVLSQVPIDLETVRLLDAAVVHALERARLTATDRRDGFLHGYEAVLGAASAALAICGFRLPGGERDPAARRALVDTLPFTFGIDAHLRRELRELADLRERLDADPALEPDARSLASARSHAEGLRLALQRALRPR